MGRRSAIPPSRGAVLGLCSLELASDRYTWRAITFLAARAGRLRDTPHGRDPPAMGRPVRVPREHETRSSRVEQHDVAPASLVPREEEEHEEHPAARHSTCFLAAGIRPRARHGRARTYRRPCGWPGSTSTKSDGRTARRRTASPLSSTRPARAPQSWRSTNTLSHRGHVTTVLPRGSTPYRRVCPFASPTRVMLRQGNLWRAVTRGIEESRKSARARGPGGCTKPG